MVLNSSEFFLLQGSKTLSNFPIVCKFGTRYESTSVPNVWGDFTQTQNSKYRFRFWNLLSKCKVGLSKYVEFESIEKVHSLMFFKDFKKRNLFITNK